LQGLGDPLFQWDSFWHQPCKLLEQVAVKVIKAEEDEANRLSVSTAKLIDTVSSIAHALYGKKGSEGYESQLLSFLPFPARTEKEKEAPKGSITPDKETIKIFFELVEKNEIPGVVFAHLQPLMADWRKIANE
jgi:hypothetical protein